MSQLYSQKDLAFAMHGAEPGTNVSAARILPQSSNALVPGAHELHMMAVSGALSREVRFSVVGALTGVASLSARSEQCFSAA